MAKRYDKHDVLRILQKQGKSLSSIALARGYSASLCRQAFLRPVKAGEEIIVAETKLKPHSIWPDRYNTDGTRKIICRKPSRQANGRKRQSDKESFTPVCGSANDCLGGAHD